MFLFNSCNNKHAVAQAMMEMLIIQLLSEDMLLSYKHLRHSFVPAIQAGWQLFNTDLIGICYPLQYRSPATL